MGADRLLVQIEFLAEADRLKQIVRNTLLLDASRRENDAEHSWHLALAAMVLAEHANSSQLDLRRVLQMVTIHDLIEIDAGDTFAYDEQAHLDKAEREARAAERIFGLLPMDLAHELRELWEDFEHSRSAEAEFANALDSFMPILHNYRTEGRQWRLHGIDSGRVLARNLSRIAAGSVTLADYIRQIVADAVVKGYLAP